MYDDLVYNYSIFECYCSFRGWRKHHVKIICLLLLQTTDLIGHKQLEHGHEVEHFKGWEQVTPGLMSPLQYEQNIGDLVSYLQWMGEPSQNTRVRVGVWVLLFLCVFTLLAWRLNAAYWKEVK